MPSFFSSLFRAFSHREDATPLRVGLVGLGLVARRAGPDDRRVRLLSITEHGQEVLRDTVVMPDSFGRELLERLTPDEVSGLLVGIRGMMRVAREGCAG